MEIRSLMSGAEGSTGKSEASTLQYSTVLPLTTWVTRAADSTRPPWVGSLIAGAGISLPVKSAHLGAVLAAAMAGGGARSAAALTAAMTRPSPARIEFDAP
jgi:hypothetical protein